MEPNKGPDKFQQAWQAAAAETRVKVDADTLLKALQHSQQVFRATILGRDAVEIAVGLLLLPYWFYMGLTISLPWTWWLMVPAILWVLGFFIVDRRRHPQKSSDPSESLLSCTKNSLTQVEHQIWLLGNVAWWYLLPFAIALLAFFCHVAWQAAVETQEWLESAVAAAFIFAITFAIYYWIYRFNQRAVRTQLEPQRQELLALLTSLGDEPANEVAGNFPILMSAKQAKCTPRRVYLGSLAGLAILIVGVPSILYIAYRINEWASSSVDERYPKRSPFAAVRWEGDQPEVEVDGQWFKLVSLNGLHTAEIIAFSWRTYDVLWQKRFEEDLVELLTRMGHPPADTVTLVVQSLTGTEEKILNDVPMTHKNRQDIWDAAQARAPDQQ
jgi:hypothetical protein